MEETLKATSVKKTKRKSVSYAKWGVIFIIPFFAIYLIFTLYPQITTFYYSFNKYYSPGPGMTIGPEFVGFENYAALFEKGHSGEILILKCLGNTIIMWVIGAVVQLGLSLLLALLFTSARLNVKCSGFFKSVFYMPNLIMASAFAFLFFALFDKTGPFNRLFVNLGWLDQPFDFVSGSKWSARGLVAFMNFLMWFGNTTILLMAGIMGIDESLFESAHVDGASSSRVFVDITLPLLKPILVYVMITSMIGGLQMYDVPFVLSKKTGGPDNTTKTLVMLLNDYLDAKNYGMSGAVAIILFIVTGVLSFFVYRSITKKDN